MLYARGLVEESVRASAQQTRFCRANITNSIRPLSRERVINYNYLPAIRASSPSAAIFKCPSTGDVLNNDICLGRNSPQPLVDGKVKRSPKSLPLRVTVTDRPNAGRDRVHNRYGVSEKFE